MCSTCQQVAGGTILCDECASVCVAAINDTLGEEFTHLPIVLTANEVDGLTSVANSWLSRLTPQEEQE